MNWGEMVSVKCSSSKKERYNQLPVPLSRDREQWKTHQGTRKLWEVPC